MPNTRNKQKFNKQKFLLEWKRIIREKDFKSFCRYVKIKNQKTREMFPFPYEVWNDEQKSFFDARMERLSRHNSPTRRLSTSLRLWDIVIKPRQIGMTTFGLLQDYFFALCNPDTLTLIIAQEKDISTFCLEQIKSIHQHFEDLSKKIGTRLVPSLSQSNKLQIQFSTNARIRIETAKQSKETANRTGRGMTIDRLHATEVAMWAYPHETMLALEPAYENAKEVLIESTANGASGWFYDKVMSLWNQTHISDKMLEEDTSKDRDTSKDTVTESKSYYILDFWTLHFFPWFLHKSYALSTDGYEIELQGSHQEPLQSTPDNNPGLGSLDVFDDPQQPPDDMEDNVEEHKEEKKKPISKYLMNRITGMKKKTRDRILEGRARDSEFIKPRDEWEEILINKYKINLNQLLWWRFKIDQHNGSYDKVLQEYPIDIFSCFRTKSSTFLSGDDIAFLQKNVRSPREVLRIPLSSLVPLTSRNALSSNTLSSNDFELEIFLPLSANAPKSSFVLSADTSFGRGQDSSVLLVINKETLEICAAGAHKRMSPNEFAHIINHVGTKIYPRSIVAVENASSGFSTLETLNKVLQYPNLFKHEHKDYYGWNTTSLNRVSMLSLVQQYVEDCRRGERNIPVGSLVHELSTFIISRTPSGLERPEAMKGAHDDYVMAFAIALSVAQTNIPINIQSHTISQIGQSYRPSGGWSVPFRIGKRTY